MTWLRENDKETCTSAAFDDAAAAGDLRGLEFIRQHYQVNGSLMAFHRAVLANQIFAASWARANSDVTVDSDTYATFFDLFGWTHHVRHAALL